MHTILNKRKILHYLSFHETQTYTVMYGHRQQKNSRGTARLSKEFVKGRIICQRTNNLSFDKHDNLSKEKQKLLELFLPTDFLSCLYSLKSYKDEMIPLNHCTKIMDMVFRFRNYLTFTVFF